MAWTDTARRQHMRIGPGYPSDLRDGEWALIKPMLPPARGGGRPRTTRLRAVMDAILYIASSGCAWRMLPKCFPPISTVRGYVYGWRDSGLLTIINHLLVMTARQQVGREASPTAGVIDSQSVKTTESGGISGYDAVKKVKGRKRHILTDTCGFLIFILVHAADIHDRDGAPNVLKAIRFRFPWLRYVFAGSAYAGAKLRDALKAHGSWTLDIIKRSDTARGFELAYMTFPKEHRAKLHSTNPIERLNGEIKRRTEVVGIFPNEAAITRLTGAILMEQSDEWAVQRACYMTLETMAPLSDKPIIALSAVPGT